MRSRPNTYMRVLPWVLLGASVVAMTATFVVGEMNGGRSTDGSWTEEILLITAFMAFPVVGAMIASRQPRNAVGWLFLGIGLLVSFGVLGDEWARYSFVTSDEPVPFGTLGAWIASWFWIPLIGTIPTLLLLLFPTGRIPSPHWVWRATLVAAIVFIGTAAILISLEETLNGDDYTVPNPVGIAGLEDVEEKLPFLALAPLVLLSAGSLIFRFVRAEGDERQQLKWVMLAATIFATGVMLGDVLDLPEMIFPVLLILLPISIAVAVLKYRLYDISVVINKTLVYAALTAVLGSVYLGVVFLLRAALPIGDESQLTVAASTLAVAGLFRPLRRWLQDSIDHVFYRRKYDAVHTVDSFSARLRDEVDLDALTSDLLGVVDETMRPSHASLWLRRSEEPAQT